MTCLLTVKEACAYLAETGRMSPAPHPCTIKRWITHKRNPLPAVRRGKGTRGQGGVWLISQADLDAFVIPHAGRPRKSRMKQEE